jgi:hypothetical protein
MFKDIQSAVNDVYEFEFLDDIILFALKQKEIQKVLTTAETTERKKKSSVNESVPAAVETTDVLTADVVPVA